MVANEDMTVVVEQEENEATGTASLSDGETKNSAIAIDRELSVKSNSDLTADSGPSSRSTVGDSNLNTSSSSINILDISEPCYNNDPTSLLEAQLKHLKERQLHPIISKFSPILTTFKKSTIIPVIVFYRSYRNGMEQSLKLNC